MKTRTCPNCGYKYLFFDYFKKIFFRFVSSKWNCANCDIELTFNTGRRALIALISMLPVVFSSVIISSIQDTGLSIVVSWIVFALVFMIWVIYVNSFDSFSLTKKVTDK